MVDGRSAKGRRSCLREEIHPGEALVVGALMDLILFLADGSRHDEELVAGFNGLNTADPLPDFVGVERFALMDEKTGTLGEEEHSTNKGSARASYEYADTGATYPANMIVEKTSDEPRIYRQLPATRRNMAEMAYPRTSPSAMLNWYSETKLPRMRRSTVSAT
jgi:hypothetical protein